MNASSHSQSSERRLRPADPWAGLALGTTLYRAGHHREALEAIGHALKTTASGKSIRAALVLAIVHERLGDSRAAHDWLDQATTIYRDFDRQAVPAAARFSWADKLELAMLRSEAEALIMYDPVFPADPFAP